MSKTIAQLALLLFCISLCSCGKKEEPASEPEQNEAAETKPLIPKADPPKAPLTGRPTGSGYTSKSIRVQLGPDEGLREQHSPGSDREFLLVRLAVDGKADLVPRDYRIVIADKQYTPHAVGFGRPNGVYASVETFVGDKVELAPGSADQIQHDGERIQRSELKNPIVFLIFDIPRIDKPSLWHGNLSFPLKPDYESLAADLTGEGGTLTASTPIQLADPNETSDEFTARLIETTRTRIELNETPTDVIVATVALRAAQETTIELKRSDIRLEGQQGSAAGGTVYFHFDTKDAILTAGSSYTEGERYERRELIGLASGSVRLPLSPGKDVTMTVIFPDPRLTGDLDLRLSPSVAVRMPGPAHSLGKFRPPVEKMPALVAWVPLVGSPTEAGYLPDPPAMAPTFKELSAAAPAKPDDGLRYLMVRFRIEQESRFVPIDYRIAEQESNTIYRPVAVDFGEAGVYVQGLDYEKLDLKMGNQTAPAQQGTKLTGWTVKSPIVTLLYEVSPADEFVFLHGDTQFLINP